MSQFGSDPWAEQGTEEMTQPSPVEPAVALSSEPQPADSGSPVLGSPALGSPPLQSPMAQHLFVVPESPVAPETVPEPEASESEQTIPVDAVSEQTATEQAAVGEATEQTVPTQPAGPHADPQQVASPPEIPAQPAEPLPADDDAWSSEPVTAVPLPEPAAIFQPAGMSPPVAGVRPMPDTAPMVMPGPSHPQNRNWPPPPRQPVKRGFSAAVLVLVIAITAIVCGVGGAAIGFVVKSRTTDKPVLSVAPTRSTSRIVLPTTPESSAATPDVGAALLGRIVPAPAASQAVTLPDAPGGVLTLQQDVQQFFPSVPTEADTLRSEGFVASAATEYTRSDGYEILTHLTQFATADGAQSYFAERASSFAGKAVVTGSFAVPGGGMGFEENKPDAAGNRAILMYAQVGTIVVTVDVYTTGQLSRALALATMTAQVTNTG